MIFCVWILQEIARKIELERRELERKLSEQELADLVSAVFIIILLPLLSWLQEIAKKLQKEEILARKREMRLKKERQELQQLQKTPSDGAQATTMSPTRSGNSSSIALL